MQRAMCGKSEIYPACIQHQAEEDHAHASRRPYCGFLQCWGDMCRVFKKLRMFDDALLERQFVKQHYRPPVYFWFITAIAVCISLGEVVYFWIVTNGISKWAVGYIIAGIVFLLCGIGLIVAARIRHIRENHWDKVALPAAVLVYAALALNNLGIYETDYSMQLTINEDPSNYTYFTCPAMFNMSAVHLAVNSAEFVICGKSKISNLVFTAFLLWIAPLSVPVFGLDVRRHAPLLVTEVIVNFAIVAGVYFRAAYLYPGVVHGENIIGNHIIFPSFLFSCIALASLLWMSLSSEIASRGAWIRQQNW